MYTFRIALSAALTFAVLGSSPSTALGQNIFSNPITGADPNTANPYTAGQTFVANLNVSGIGRGPGINGTNANDRYNATSWNTVALDPDAYFTWTLTPAAGYALDLNSLVYVGQASGTGPNSAALRSSADNYAADIVTMTVPTTGNPTSPFSLGLSGSAFQNAQTATEFRLYGWGATAAGGTFSVNDFTFNGVVSNRWNGAASGNLTTAGNYVSGNAPIATNGIQFEGSTNTAVTVNAATNVAGLRFASGAASFTISGANLLTIGVGGVGNYSANAQRINASVAFNTAGTSVVNNGTLTFGGSVSLTNGLSLRGTGTTVMNGPLTGANGNLNVFGGTLAGTGTISRAVSVNPGGAIRGGDPNGSAAERVGTLIVNGMNVTITSDTTTNGIFRVEASRTSGNGTNGTADASAISVTGGGDLRLNPGDGNKFTIDLVNGTNSLQLGETYTIQLAGVNAIVDLQLNNSAIGPNQMIASTNYVLTSSAFAAFDNVSLTTGASGAALFLTFTPVPEPATVLGIAAAALGAGGLVRRRLRGKAGGAMAV